MGPEWLPSIRAELATILLVAQKYREAQMLLKTQLPILKTSLPDRIAWQGAYVEGILGACLVAQQKNAQTKLHLLNSLKVIQAAPVEETRGAQGVIERLIQLYESVGAEDGARQCRALREK